MTEYIYI